MQLFVPFLIGTCLSPLTQAISLSPLELQFPLLHELRNAKSIEKGEFRSQALSVSFAEHNFSVPVDHFHNESRYEPHSDDSFNLRYWFDASHYKEGGPVFLIAAGETDATDRFPFLSQGIVAQLAKTYNGLGVILEHRYYGESYPFVNLTVENIRFLSTEQALADYAHFASNVAFPGLEHLNLTAGAVPWIGYGGSYAGAFVAFLRKVYPDIFFGVVSSSGVTAAIEDYWQYYEPIRQFAPSDCVWNLERFMHIADTVLIDHATNATLKSQLKAIFGADSTVSDDFFAAALSDQLGAFQGRNWDPAVGSGAFQLYCKNITSPISLYQHNATIEAWTKEIVSVAQYDATNASLVTGLLNYAGYLNASTFSRLRQDASQTDRTSRRLSTAAAAPQPRPLDKSMMTSWSYQVCTEWGYFMPGSTVPPDRLSLVSRLLTLPKVSAFCRADFGITGRPDTGRINKHGGFNFSYARAAIIDGLADPWREATPHADGARPRTSTDDEPFILVDIAAEEVWDGIRGAVHHWDQNGLSDEDLGQGKRLPRGIVELHQEIKRFVGLWLAQWGDKRTVVRPGVSRDGPTQTVLH
ncbi:putative extracelular serine carboxypeptidase [Aspergillus clavatus NRRL 1]|uniref:Extracelular serine carboxypeptidase, putative n=1 Tax=Aspergillus clavatus (strain ATCC 1007 / CBS 513.65 / DSM 816 / NCTC 3887 / NRRL 1 / QM 1276 / 107) TaxID=344612 RepID=A1C859_ASPCL|nr:extracelular serine carboxypeptidase, putative [Aspergillus clavatus NRRL 1]EAW14580.1 extracelular serine carboxypeptidase, putative [Aspergillus clavatus NRRL 1]